MERTEYNTFSSPWTGELVCPPVFPRRLADVVGWTSVQAN